MDGTRQISDAAGCLNRLWVPVANSNTAVVACMRVDAALDDPAPAREADTTGRPALTSPRQPTLTRCLSDPALV